MPDLRSDDLAHRAPGAAPRGLRAPAWLALCAAAAAGACLAWLVPAYALDWQPDQAWAQPWRWLTAALVHWREAHLALNLAGLAVVAGLGEAAALGGRWALAWLLAWPLTHAALLLQPELAHYGGLSGVLHAAVAVAGVALLAGSRRGTARAGRHARAAGALLLAGLAAKLAADLADPAALQPDIARSVLAHAGGAAAGAVLAVCTAAWSHRPARPTGPPSSARP